MVRSGLRNELGQLLVVITDSKNSEEREAAARVICRRFHPDTWSEAYADLLGMPGTPYASKDLILRILFIVADEEALCAISACVRDPEAPMYLRTKAALLLIKLDFDLARRTVAEGLPCLLPLIEDEDRNPSGAREPVLVELERADSIMPLFNHELGDRSRRFTQAVEDRPLVLSDPAVS